MEAALLIDGIGNWKNFDELEDSLILDELLLLHEAKASAKKDEYRFYASLQGVELNDDGPDDEGSDGLPEELLAAEREHQKRKAQYLLDQGIDPDKPGSSVVGELNQALPGGFGYKRQ